PGLRVAADARRTVMQREAAEPADLDPLARRQRTGHHFQQRLDGEVHVLGLQVRLAACQDLDQFGLGHLVLGEAGRYAAATRDHRVAAGPNTLAGITRTCCPAAHAAARPGWWCRR